MKNDELRDLLTRLSDGTQTEADARRLNELLRGDPEACELYLNHVALEAQLHREFGGAPAELLPGFATPIARGKIVAFPRWLALAACLAVMLGVAASYQFSRSQNGELQVVGAENARLVERADLLLVGATLPLRELALESGFLRVRLGNGVLLDLNGPLSATFESSMKMRLLHGRMSVDVGADGKGFTVVTDAGEVVDLGTRFGVEADAKGESRVAVFSGEVKVRTGGSGAAFTNIHEGEAVRFTALAGLRRWTEVALAVDAAGLERTPREGVIASARDNLGSEKLHPFYGIVHGGMQPGALAFTDKPNPRWAPMPGDSLPAWLQGADLVRTYHQFRHKRDYALTLTLREAADVSVLIDARQEPPAWLKERFTDSGARVRVGPWMQKMTETEGVEIGKDGEPYMSFAVWRATASAGEFVLGPVHEEKLKNAPSALMYGVAVKPLPNASK
jgi:ferric-dicitrate binding protein FerR (iron transport regulator)